MIVGCSRQQLGGTIRKAIASIWAVYRDIYDALGVFLTVFAALLGVVGILFVTHPGILAEFGGVAATVLAVALIAPAVLGLARSFTGDDVLSPPGKVKDFFAVSYSTSSDADMREMTRFAMEKFGETFPAEVDAGAVRNGSALGLRLTDDKGRNIGFLDVYHFRDDVLAAWREGDIQETSMTLDQFVPIASLLDRTSQDINLVLGALYIDTANPLADFHLAYCLIEAAKDYLHLALKDFRSANVYATIFNRQAGARWAKKEGFELSTRGDKRGAFGGGHDVLVLNFKPGGGIPREYISTFGRNCEYRVRLRLQ